MKTVKRISLIVVAVLVLACSAPLSSLAVDPVSAATMANALAQAITAYGASQGVSMTFDVASTDGIGEGVHELWDQYQADMSNSSVSVSDYQNLAASAFPTLWIKIGEKIGVNLDAALVGEIDGFWNWLLSGPAEMTKVDNQYYEWTINQDDSVTPINVYYSTNSTLLGYPVVVIDSSIYEFTITGTNNHYSMQSSLIPVYGIARIPNSTETDVDLIGISGSMFTVGLYNNGSFQRNSNSYTLNSNVQQINGFLSFLSPVTIEGFPVYTNDLKLEFLSALQNASSADLIPSTYESDISVQPYIGDEVPQNVYIPDNTDVNYEPIPASIPTDISWDDTLFGDGTGILTDAQSEAITQTVDQAIADNPAKTIELAESNPPAPSPSEVYIPFLPVTLPSFNFSLSGIWHYVTAWVASLGAWFSLVFTTWSYLPYAISVPVYATAVIVIVLGVYKRFFM